MNIGKMKSSQLGNKVLSIGMTGTMLLIVSGFVAPLSFAATQKALDLDGSTILKDFLTPRKDDEFDASQLFRDLGEGAVVENKIRSLIDEALIDIRNGKRQEGLAKLKDAWAMDKSLPVAGVIIASTYLQGKEYSAALEVAKGLQNQSPDSPEGYTLAGIAYIGIGDEKLALVSFEKALEIHPGDPEAGRNLAALYFKQGNVEKARTTLNNVLTQNPDHLQTLNTLADLEFKSNNPQKAVSLLESGVAKNPNQLEPRILLAQIYLSIRQPSKAIALLEESLQRFPERPELMQFAGVTFLQNGFAGKALPLLQSTVKALPNDLAVHYNLALTLEQLGRKQDALNEIDKALKLDPTYESSKFVRARLMASNGQFDSAEKLLKELKDSDPDSANIPELLGKIAMAKNKPEEAIGYFNVALKKQGDNPLLIVQLAMAQIAMQKIEAGYETLREWIAKHPNDISVRMIFADMLLDKRNFEDAQKYYVEVLKLQPDRLDASNNLAWLLAEKGELDKGLELAEKNHQLAPKDPLVTDTLAAILLKKNQAKRATELLREALTVSPDNVTIKYHLAQSLVSFNKEEAKNILRNLLSSKQVFKEREASNELLKKLESQ
ncbi:XrtA/PEP-CTERM system TPR-repeat protein PrsT [Methylomonas sp. 2BW1-5-20]|uniref:XrtA/PEP-CTERM system TPR-repeat protein PrsT n=1 Tax=Methylomonas sp. 2BW1-5-20 TaxID=3376686 RepID=UPI00405224DF